MPLLSCWGRAMKEAAHVSVSPYPCISHMAFIALHILYPCSNCRRHIESQLHAKPDERRHLLGTRVNKLCAARRGARMEQHLLATSIAVDSLASPLATLPPCRAHIIGCSHTCMDTHKTTQIFQLGSVRSATHLENGGAEGDFEVLLHVSGQRSATTYDEAHAAAKGLLEGVEQILVQQRRSLQQKSPIISAHAYMHR